MLLKGGVSMVWRRSAHESFRALLGLAQFDAENQYAAVGRRTWALVLSLRGFRRNCSLFCKFSSLFSKQMVPGACSTWSLHMFLQPDDSLLSGGSNLERGSFLALGTAKDFGLIHFQFV